MSITAVVIRGDFTRDEFNALVARIRELDRARPDAKFEICAADPDGTAIETADMIVRGALPPEPDRQTRFTALPRPAPTRMATRPTPTIAMGWAMIEQGAPPETGAALRNLLRKAYYAGAMAAVDLLSEADGDTMRLQALFDELLTVTGEP